MDNIIIYSTAHCPWCVRARDLLDRKNIPYQDIRVDEDDAKRDEMLALSGGRQTVPQIFINGRHVGGCDDLYALDREGGLDNLTRNREKS